ncbi:MAG: entericidin EcnAB [Alphaproteobacteria bacterium]|nr:MAG: entericidin EcnAB [Alphaproteobacteria bacterium]
MRKRISLLLATLALAGLSGCATVQGIGTDLQKAGTVIKSSARSAQANI